MVAHKKLGSDVDIGELAGITKNFSGAELEGLVRWESCLVKSVRSKLDVMTMDDVVFLKEADGKKSIPSFRAAQSCALNRLVKADSKVNIRIFFRDFKKKFSQGHLSKGHFQVEVDVDAAEKLMVCRFADYNVVRFLLYK